MSHGGCENIWEGANVLPGETLRRIAEDLQRRHLGGLGLKSEVPCLAKNSERLPLRSVQTLRQPTSQFSLHRILFDRRRGPRAAGWDRAVPIDVAGEVHHGGHSEEARHCADQKRVVLQAQ
jgi:hypothetical protein